MNDLQDRLGKPVPVRLEESSDDRLTLLARQTGLTKSELIRRACKWAFPKFMSGELPVVQMVEGRSA